jgi:hypothetical protein
MTSFFNQKSARPDLARQAGCRPREVFALSESHDMSDDAVPLFTSAAQAMDYGRVRGWERRACSIAASDLATRAGVWVRRGATRFTLNRCARCTAAHFVTIDMLRRPEPFSRFWAFTLALEEARMRHFAVLAFRSLLNKRVEGIVPKLKESRDHVNAGCAAVHYALGLLHSLEAAGEREELLAVSQERLVELGRADLADSIPGGGEGLRRGFAVLRRMANGDFAEAVEHLEIGMRISQKR